MGMQPYLLDNAMRFLSDSGLAEMIMKSGKEFKIPYRKIPRVLRTSKHGDRIIESPRYYKFLSDYLHAVISLVEDSPRKSSIKFTSKYLEMDCDSVECFRRGWPILTNVASKK